MASRSDIVQEVVMKGSRKDIYANCEPECEHPAEGDICPFRQWYWGNALKPKSIGAVCKLNKSEPAS